MSSKSQIQQLTNLFSDEAIDLLSSNGAALVQKIGIDTVRTVVLDVLSGRNLRDSTEFLTRSRLATLNAAAVNMIVRGINQQPDFVEKMPEIAERILKKKRLSKPEKWVAQWILGLTDKASQNVLRDDASLLTEYRDRYTNICEEIINNSINEYGNITGNIKIGNEVAVNLNWKFMVYLLGMVGSQTLTIRGSEKSTYGKLFERLVLGSLLELLGFQFTIDDKGTTYDNEFWLSSQGDKRESDATALWKTGKGVRFDIGFIGRGNPEISLDKVTRFSREIELGPSLWYMATIIIVDRIGNNSKIVELANEVHGDIVQMSMTYWPQQVAQILHDRMGFEHPLVNMPRDTIHDYLATEIKNINLEKFLPSS